MGMWSKVYFGRSGIDCSWCLFTRIERKEGTTNTSKNRLTLLTLCFFLPDSVYFKKHFIKPAVINCTHKEQWKYREKQNDTKTGYKRSAFFALSSNPKAQRPQWTKLVLLYSTVMKVCSGLTAHQTVDEDIAGTTHRCSCITQEQHAGHVCLPMTDERKKGRKRLTEGKKERCSPTFPSTDIRLTFDDSLKFILNVSGLDHIVNSPPESHIKQDFLIHPSYHKDELHYRTASHSCQRFTLLTKITSWCLIWLLLGNHTGSGWWSSQTQREKSPLFWYKTLQTYCNGWWASCWCYVDDFRNNNKELSWSFVKDCQDVGGRASLKPFHTVIAISFYFWHVHQHRCNQTRRSTLSEEKSIEHLQPW